MSVISLADYRSKRLADGSARGYENQILKMSKVDLLEEMVRFQEKRKITGYLTPKLIAEGIPLFKALRDQADSQELRILSQSYLRHLQYELLASRKGE